MKQTTNTIAMVRPAAFRLNEQTAVNNHYQNQKAAISETKATNEAQLEFDAFAKSLQEVGVNVIVMEDDSKHDTPDSVFPNNWISTHENGDIALYPMFAENRRLERRPEFLERLEKSGFKINHVVDYTTAEEEGFFLEGTGSLVLDRVNRKAYCSLSERADEDLVIEFCEDFEYTPVIFSSYQSVNGKRLPIYHTNVMMAMGTDFVVICLDCIDDKAERKNVVKHLKVDGKEIISITEAQVSSFAGNMMLVHNKDGELILVMSTTAFDSLQNSQITSLSRHAKIQFFDVSTIEELGGGSVRCMMAEVFLPFTDS